MPQLDVSFVLDDPMFRDDTLSVIRRQDVVGGNGRTTPTQLQRWDGISGVVTQQSPSDLLRRDDSQSIPRRILVVTKFLLYGPSKDGSAPTPIGYQPDQVIWNGTTYTVEAIQNYSTYGGGFIEAVCGSQNATDGPTQ